MVALSANHVQIPRISGTIDRPRLINKLRTAADHRLTIVSAPPGFGKTTLVAQFAHELPYPIVWHTIEERERDVPSLFAQCVRAFSHVVPSIQSLNPAPGTPPNELATLITNHLRKYMLTDTLYILDDVHNLAGSLGAEAWLRAMIAMLPSKCHLIVVSRILPDLPLTEMIARGDVLAIGQRELQFTPHEAQELAAQISANVTSPAEIDEITARLEGWPAGIVLALHPLPSDLEHVMLSGGRGPEALFDALASLMLNAQTAKLRSFLLASSTLKRLTPELCAEVLQWTDGLYWMESVQSRNLFASKTSGGLMYHGLFRDFLQRQLRESDAGLYIRLHAKAGEWFERSNQPDEAFEHFLSADESLRAATLSETLAQSYFTQGRTETLLRWASQLDAVELHPPKLLYTCAMIETDRYEYPSAEEKLQYAELEFTARHNIEGVRSVQLQKATISLQKGDYAAAVRQAQTLIEDRSLPLNLRARALNLLGIGQLRLGDTESSIRALESAIPLYRQDGDDYALSHSLQNLELAYTRLGRLDDAGACLQEVVAIRRALQSSGALALALNNLGYHYHLRSDYEQALATFEEGVSIAAQVPDKRAEGYLLWSLGDLQRDLGNFDDALRLYAKGIELIGAGEPSLRSSILISASILRRWQRQYDEAIAHAEEAVSLATIHNLGLEYAFAQAMMQAAYGVAAPSEMVLQQLDVVCDELRQQGAQLELMRVLAVQTNISLLLGDQAAAQHYLYCAQENSQTASIQQPFAAEVIQAPLLKSFISSTGKRGFVQRELKSLQEAQSKLCHQRPVEERPFHNTYSLNIVTLGQEVMERDGEIIPASRWRATTARELFLYLLFVGPQSREDFSLAFWPDSSIKHVRSNFHTTLYRARQALGENAIVFQDGVYLINPEIELRCDALKLKQLTTQARVLPARDARTEDLWQRAVELYRGDFLPSLYADWVLPLREAFHEMYIEALIGLGDCARARGDFRHALASLKLALKADPYREDVHRAIMTCYAQKGEKKQIATHLAELQQLFWRELSIKPSSETMALARSLLS